MRSLSRREALTVAAGAAAALAASRAESLEPEQIMRKAAVDLIAALGPDLAQKTTFPVNSDERFNWHYIPKERKGVAWKEMDSHQQDAAKALLRSGLSQKGIERLQTIRLLENVLKEIEQGKGHLRDPDNYHFTIFGEPSDKGIWGWRYEGHHVSLNFTLADGQVVASTPQFWGANPAEVREGPMTGTRALAAEEDLGRALIKALSPEQQKTAIISDTAPGDILTAAARKAGIQEDKGLAFKGMAPEHQGMLISLVQQYASTNAPELARERIAKARKAGLATVKFAWMGGLEKGDKHYYRIQGLSFLIEYDNTQNDANHVHTVWRDFDGDWGADLLEHHYKTAPDGHGHDH